jgi:rhodanese-related sulfurtransferase
MPDFVTFLNNHLALSYTFAAVFFVLLLVEFLRNKRLSFRIAPTRAVQLINHESAAVIDLRQPDEFRKGHIVNAVSMSTTEIQDGSKKLDKFKSKPIILVCQRGLESQKVAAFLLKQGYNVHTLAGGIGAWTDANLPLIKES